MKQNNAKTWFSVSELADMTLPGLPTSNRKINERARDERWALRSDDNGRALARKRAGRGGGLEYHISLLPEAARIAILKHHGGDDAAQNGQPKTELWAWFDGQNDKIKAEAKKRLDAVKNIDDLTNAGLTRTMAVAAAAAQHKVSTATLWNWLNDIKGIAASDWLPCLAPRRKGGGAKAQIDPRIWKAFLSDYLRLSKPPLSSCYYRIEELAKVEDIAIPTMRTFQRKLEREVDEQVIVLRREGNEALRQSMPSQTRSVAHMHAMERVNIDGHTFDVFVKTPDGRTVRPVMVAIQDIYSRKILSWRIGESESAILTRLAFADLFKDYGIPKGCLLDNGRAFASKWITGGATNRFRFKVKEDEPTGLLTSLGIENHWATPYRGQSKPIERAFRDLCNTISKHPACEGAYTGNSPLAKPENYASKAVDWERFERLVISGIAAHNARTKRNTETARGRSFDEVFAESYACNPIGKATEEQLRLALLTAEQLKVDRKTGEIRFHGNRYWSTDLGQHHGQQVVVRFDPDNLHAPLHVYDRAGAYICGAEIIENAGFNDVAAAKRRGKQASDHRKAVKRAAELEDLMSAEDLAAMLPDHHDETELPDPQVVRAVKHRAVAGARAQRVAQQDDTITSFTSAVARLKIVE